MAEVPNDTYSLMRAIEEREKLMGQLVGNLYPGILQREIDELKERLPTARPGTVLCGLRRFQKPVARFVIDVPDHAGPGYQDEIPQTYDHVLRSKFMSQGDLFFIEAGHHDYVARWEMTVPLGPIFEIVEVL